MADQLDSVPRQDDPRALEDKSTRKSCKRMRTEVTEQHFEETVKQLLEKELMKKLEKSTTILRGTSSPEGQRSDVAQVSDMPRSYKETESDDMETDESNLANIPSRNASVYPTSDRRLKPHL